MSSKDIIKGIRQIASQVLPEGADAILFGSRARGDARRDSDWDILILINGSKATGADFESFAYPFVEYGWSVGEQINPLIYSYEDWHKRSITPFYKNIQAEGISLCHRQNKKGKRYIRTGILSKEDGTLLARLQNMRHTGDYDDFIDWTQEDVDPYISKVESYLEKVKKVIYGQ